MTLAITGGNRRNRVEKFGSANGDLDIAGDQPAEPTAEVALGIGAGCLKNVFLERLQA